jgi:hypothetical protein
MAVGVTVCLTTALASAQTTATSTENKPFEVIAVSGNDLVVKMPEGTRELRVPDDFRFTVNGRSVPVSELKPGMIGTATITTRTTITPVTVTEVKNGTVAQVSPSTIVVRTDEGLRSFSQSDVDKRGVKIMRDGKPAQLSDFRTGDTLSATIITTHPPVTMTEREVQAAITAVGAGPPAAPTVPDQAAHPAQAPTVPDQAALPAQAPAAVGTTGSPTAPEASPARELPKTAGPLPLIGLVGVTALAIGAALTSRRRRLGR